MRRRPAAPRSPLPQRHGVDPVRRRLPEDGGGWATVHAYLTEFLPVEPALVDALFAGDAPGDGGARHGRAALPRRAVRPGGRDLVPP
ncbi:hypothetical protein GCM10020229_54950 [Kitasatospora albolonga]